MTFRERIMRPVESVQTGGWTLKGYHLTIDGSAIDSATVQAASAALSDLVPAPRRGSPRHGFFVLHRGEDAVWLMLWVWAYADIVAVSGASASLDAPTDFAPIEEPLAGCVWELAAQVHERSAWVRHALVPDEPDHEAYVRDVLAEGPVGRP